MFTGGIAGKGTQGRIDTDMEACNERVGGTYPADEVGLAYKRGFEEGHKHAHCERFFGFGSALVTIKQGGRVAREGWNGKGMHIYLVPHRVLHAGNNPDLQMLGLGNRAFGDGYAVNLSPFIMMRTATGELVPWLASQTDLLAEDWMEAR